MLLLIFLAGIAASAGSEDPLAGHRCTIVRNNDGFKCTRGGGCIPLEWVCDEEVQCELPDESDEGFGCDLYPETGCNSVRGERHVKCTNSNQCVKNLSECEVDPQDPQESGGGRVNYFCDEPQGNEGGEGFRDDVT